MPRDSGAPCRPDVEIVRSKSSALRGEPTRAKLVLPREGPLGVVVRQLERYAKSDEVILIEGERGTGKTELAGYVHSVSKRSKSVYYAESLASLEDGLSAADLFGNLRGAYTGAERARAGIFASAHSGTLFLEELAHASPSVQAKLLDVLQRKQCRPLGPDRFVNLDVRVLFACNVPLPRLVAEGKIRADLADRIGALRVTVPPLRERRQDIPALIAAIIEEMAPADGYATPPLMDPELLRRMQGDDWSGNVRELRSAIRKLLLDAEGAPTIHLGHCFDELARFTDEKPRLTPELVRDTLAAAKGNITEASRRLHVSRPSIYAQLDKLPGQPARRSSRGRRRGP